MGVAWPVSRGSKELFAAEEEASELLDKLGAVSLQKKAVAPSQVRGLPWLFETGRGRVNLTLWAVTG